MEFKAAMVYDKRAFRALVKALRLRKRGGRFLDKVSRACSVFAGGLLLLFSLLMLCSAVTMLFGGGGAYPVVLVCGLVFLLLGLFLCLPGRDRFLTWLSWRQYKEKGMEVKYEFHEACFMEHTPVSDHRFDYSVVEDVMEDRNYYFLFVNANMAHTIGKEDFQIGNAESFRPFMEEKCGKPVRFVR